MHLLRSHDRCCCKSPTHPFSTIPPLRQKVGKSFGQLHCRHGQSDVVPLLWVLVLLQRRAVHIYCCTHANVVGVSLMMRIHIHQRSSSSTTSFPCKSHRSRRHALFQRNKYVGFCSSSSSYTPTFTSLPPIHSFSYNRIILLEDI